MPVMLIAAPAGHVLPFSADDLDRAAVVRWGDAARTTRMPYEATTIHVHEPGGTLYRIALDLDGDAITCEGDFQKQIEVAVWVRSLIPSGFPRVIAFDENWRCHVDLVPGITAEQFDASVVDHSVPGWNDGDPDLR